MYTNNSDDSPANYHVTFPIRRATIYQIIHDINISKIKILSNSGKKPRVGLSGYGLSIDEYIKY